VKLCLLLEPKSTLLKQNINSSLLFCA